MGKSDNKGGNGRPAKLTDVIVRGAQPGDGDAILELVKHPGVVGGGMTVPVLDTRIWHHLLTNPQDGMNIVVAETQGQIVGQGEMFTFPRMPRRNHVAQLACMVHHAWQGRGIGRALMVSMIELGFRWMNLRRLELTVWVDNEHAIKLYEDLGFVIEGRCRGYVLRDGELVDALCMALMRDPAPYASPATP